MEHSESSSFDDDFFEESPQKEETSGPKLSIGERMKLSLTQNTQLGNETAKT